MINPKTKKIGRSSRDAALVNNNSSVITKNNGVDGVDSNRVCLGNVGSEDRIGNLNADGSMEDTSDAYGDQDSSDGNTSTSFSLQECMNEFRTRRIRKLQSWQETGKGISRKSQICVDAAEQDLINQNLCNKEQERRCKPCQNGFCYCFTSDSGDRENWAGFGTAGGFNARILRRNRPSEYDQILKSAKSSKICPELKEYSLQTPKTTKNTTLKSNQKENQLTAISKLGTSTRDAPLVHIIQELHNNCVISEVRVNKERINSHLMKKFINGKSKYSSNISVSKNGHSRSTYKDDYKGFCISLPEKLEPTAPPLEKISEYKKNQNIEYVTCKLLHKPTKCAECVERHRNAGGQLLRKRLSHSQLEYIPKNMENPPPKPPRSPFSNNEEYFGCTASTSLSVREAETVVDDFLAKKGFKTISGISNTDMKLRTIPSEKNELYTKCENDKRKSYPLSPKEINKHKEKLFIIQPSLSDIEGVVESQKDVNYGENIRPVKGNNTKLLRSGWHKSKINHMLNYDANTKSEGFRSTVIQAKPQQRTTREEKLLEKAIEWRVLPKVSLDTVDGIERLNLASNVEDKNTPVKTKLISSFKLGKNSSQRQKFLWSEQLRQLSPWVNKNNIDETTKKKSDLRFTSGTFIKTSKTKFLHLISPKKDNKDCVNIEIPKTPFHNIGVQTSYSDLLPNHFSNKQYGNKSTPQSPPGSYHSPMQSPPSSTQSQNTTSNITPMHFDFSRIVHSPSKKASRSSQRKLNFSCKRVESKNGDFDTIIELAKENKTYRSFNKDLDQDVSISKVSHILSNIRTKLAQRDAQTDRTFQDTGSNVEHCLSEFNCSDNHRTVRGRHIPTETYNKLLTDPVYSEIEDGSIHIIESPNFGNCTGVLQLGTDNRIEMLYAKVNKGGKRVLKTDESLLQQKQLPLATIMKDSLKNKKILADVTRLPSLPEPLGSNVASYSPQTSMAGSLSHCQSLNNVRAMEHITKEQFYLSKSDLSLHRSEVFLENLCRSELIVGAGFAQESFEKVKNTLRRDVCRRPSEKDQELQSIDNVSYEMPNDVDDDDDETDSVAKTIYENNSTSAISNLDLTIIEPVSSNNQSALKKQSFTTKDDSILNELNVNIVLVNNKGHIYNSCLNMPHKLYDIYSVDQQHQSHSHSFNEALEYEFINRYSATSNIVSKRCKILKNALQKSFEKSKQFIKNRKKRLSTSLSLSPSNVLGHSVTCGSTSSTHGDSDLNLDELFSLSESASLSEQIAHTVSICRKLPDLNISAEMVEAERLLLFSSLRQENQVTPTKTIVRSQTMYQQPKIRFFVDDMILPVCTDVSKDIFFNYFYIVTFECGGIIKSTQSAECENGVVVFRDCGLEFMMEAEFETNVVRCNVFVLRLRKISTLPVDMKKQVITETSLSTSTSSSSSSVHKVVSRFRLYGTFTLDASNFVPYEYLRQESHNSDRICIRASRICNIHMIPQTKSPNLSLEVKLNGRAEVRFRKHVFEGYLNVEDPYLQHNWNQRWCMLDGIYLYVWNDENTLNTNPLMVLDLRDTKQNTNYPLTTSPRELCARPRSFCLECITRKACKNLSRANVFFSAESQEVLDDWLKNLNIVLDFIATWLS